MTWQCSTCALIHSNNTPQCSCGSTFGWWVSVPAESKPGGKGGDNGKEGNWGQKGKDKVRDGWSPNPKPPPPPYHKMQGMSAIIAGVEPCTHRTSPPSLNGTGNRRRRINSEWQAVYLKQTENRIRASGQLMNSAEKTDRSEETQDM